MSTGGSTFDEASGSNFPITESMDYSSQVGGSDSYYNADGAASSVTGHGHSYYHQQDATDIVHEMYLALLYLLSNPDEFKKALHTHPPRGATTLDEWNAEIEEDEESVMTSATATTPLPFIVFADDAEGAKRQKGFSSYTASQLFGIEKVEGIELEAAVGIPALSQLFLRKTHPASETLKKSSQKFFSMMGKAQKAVAKSEVNKRASAHLSKMAENVKHRVGEAVHQMNSPNKANSSAGGSEEAADSKEFAQAIPTQAEAASGEDVLVAGQESLSVAPNASTRVSEGGGIKDEISRAEV
ncbi:MAG: hypothetical protein SGILL_001582 [Bacillariaceae sp.]